MKYDIILAGVGGQGVLSVSAIIASAAMKEGLQVKQSEVHGMSQRGGSVLANLRLADAPIASDLIPIGGAAMILSMEPLESLRYLRYLSPDGALVTSTNPVVNIPDYPELNGLLAVVRSLPFARLVDGETLEHFIRTTFAAKGGKIVETNLKAFRAGREAAE